MQLERYVTGQHLDTALQGLVQNVHPDFEGFKKALFFNAQDLCDSLGLTRHIGIGLAHELDQVRDQLVKERRLLTQQVTVSNGAADDTALDIAAPFVARHHAVTHQECGGANMVGNHAQALVAQISATRFAGSGLDQRVKNIDFVVAVHVLQDGR